MPPTDGVVQVGHAGAAKTTGLLALAISQVEMLSLTLMVYEPATKPLNVLDACHVAPLSFEYCKFEPVAVTVIVPSFAAGQLDTEGSVFETLVIVGVAGCALMTVDAAVDTQPLVLSFTIT